MIRRGGLWCAVAAWTAVAGCGYLQAAAVVAYLQTADRKKDSGSPPAANTTVNVTTPTGVQSNSVPLGYLLIDPEADPANIAVEFAFNAGAWTPASESVGPPSEGTTGLSASPGGTAHVFVWNSFFDVGGQNGTAQLRVRANGGAWQASGPFSLQNRLIATVAGGSTGVLSFPGGVAIGTGAGKHVYIADTFNHRIQVLNTGGSAIAVAGVSIPANQLGVVAGTGTAGFNGDNQSATQAQLNFPAAVAVDNNGNIFVADTLNHRIRRIDAATGFITTVAGTGVAGNAGDGSLGPQAQLDSPRGIAFDGAGNLYVSDTGNHTLRVLNNQSGTIQVPATGGVSVTPNTLRTFCGTAGTPGGGGDGNAAGSATLDLPWQIAFDSNGHLYVADSANHRVRAINMGGSTASLAGTSVAAGDIDTVAGNGTQDFQGDGNAARLARFDTPRGVRLDAADNLYIADTVNGRVRAVNAQGSAITLAGVTIAPGNVDTVAGGGSPASNNGNGGAATSAHLSNPEGLAIRLSGELVVADTGHAQIRAANTGTVGTSLAGVTIAPGDIDLLAGAATSATAFLKPVALARTGNTLYVADEDSYVVYAINLVTGAAPVFAGTGANTNSGDGGAPTSAGLKTPRGLALDGAGNVYILVSGAGASGDRVRVVNTQSTAQSFHGVSIAPGAIDQVAQGTGPTRFADSRSITVDGSGNLFIAHRGGDRIMQVDGAGTHSALTGGTAGYADGSLGSAQFLALEGVWADAAGNLVIADTANHAIRYANLGGSSVTVCGISCPSGQVTTVAGSPPGSGAQQGFNGDNQTGTATLLDSPTYAVRDASGNLLIIDAGNQRIRRVWNGATPALSTVTTLAGTGTAGFNNDGIPPVNAHLNGPTQCFLDGSSPANLFFCDAGNRRVRRFTP